MSRVKIRQLVARTEAHQCISSCHNSRLAENPHRRINLEMARSSSSINQSSKRSTYMESRPRQCPLNLKSQTCTVKGNEEQSITSISKNRAPTVFIMCHQTLNKSDIKFSLARIHKGPYSNSIKSRAQASRRYQTTHRLRRTRPCRDTTTRRRISKI